MGIFTRVPNNSRSYTGHEPITLGGDNRIIHMNGRIYDADTGRFMQADPFVQAPNNLQNYNAYTYVLNNPLSYTDPSGYLFSALKKVNKKLKPFTSLIVGVGLIYITGGTASWFASSWYGAATAGAISGAAGAAANGGNILKGALTGAASAAAFYGVGTAFGKVEFGSMLHAGKIAAHGLVGGVMAELQGGNFGHGFVAAGVTQAFAPGIDTIDAGSSFSIARVVVSAIVGGTASKLSGGKFSNGAVTGGFSRMFNDEMHHSKQEGDTPSIAGKTKVSLGFSDVAGGAAQHAYVLVEGPDGQVYAIRGGPSAGGGSSGGLPVVSADASSTGSSSEGKFGNLTVHEGARALAIEGRSVSVGTQLVGYFDDYDNVVNTLSAYGVSVNESNIPYMPLSTNSNSFAFGAVQQVLGFRPESNFRTPGSETVLPVK
nr:RHS repeat-associated core domain-containing protein [Pseudoalteromonas sp. XMcav2-N]